MILKRQETIDILLKYQCEYSTRFFNADTLIPTNHLLVGQPELKRLNHDFKAVDQE